jgi:hypothetical protein
MTSPLIFKIIELYDAVYTVWKTLSSGFKNYIPAEKYQDSLRFVKQCAGIILNNPKCRGNAAETDVRID